MKKRICLYFTYRKSLFASNGFSVIDKINIGNDVYITLYNVKNID